MQHRQERVADAIKQVVARVVVEELNDPGIGFVSVTRCKVTRDLKIATVYFSVLGDEQQRDRSMAKLKHAAGFIRRHVARALNLRYTPELRFAFDDLREHEYQVGKLLDEVMPEPPPAGEEEPAGPNEAPDREAE
ncbi:MAG: 30S ribosome-binding factor RbfA [bacterium]